MSYAGDNWHHDRAVQQQVGRHAHTQWKADRQAARTGKHFIEFYDDKGEPSPTGILLTRREFWGVIYGVGECGAIMVPTVCVRALVYPKFLRRVEWGGDGRAFAGSTEALTRLVSFTAEPQDVAELRLTTERLGAEILRNGPPQKPSEQSGLWSDDEEAVGQ